MYSIVGRLLLLPSALLAISLSYASARAIESRDATTSIPPIDFAADQTFSGIDGSWSTFTIAVGSPPQNVQTYLSWEAYQTLVVLPQGCTSATNVSACETSRGGIFNPANSTTWVKQGFYYVWIEDNLGYSGDAKYGFDTVRLGGSSGDGPSLNHTTVAGYAVTDFYTGLFGVNPQPTNFSSLADPSPSYMTLLKEQKYIPSVSFGYTAGASYRNTGMPASLTLGGYDASKFIENDVEFVFAPDNDRDTVVVLQSISTESQQPSDPTPVELLSGPVEILLDATVPQIWLPLNACKAFEREFGLVYDNSTGLYLVSTTLHTQLKQRNPQVTFQLGTSPTSQPTIAIVLPYAAFDLTATAPYQGLTADTKYFPLRRATNDTQYTFGRTFFQEAYVTVDYESQRFNVSQRSWDQGSSKDLVGIKPGTASGEPSSERVAAGQPSSGDALSPGDIAGIVVGVVALVALLALLALFLVRRRRKYAAIDDKDEKSPDIAENLATETAEVARGNVFPKAELEASSSQRSPDPLPPVEHRGLLARPSDSPSSATRESAVSRSVVADSSDGEDGLAHHSPSDDAHVHHSTSEDAGDSDSGAYPAAPASDVSRFSHASASGSAFDPKPRPIYEMVGDMPPIREKDGRGEGQTDSQRHRREGWYNAVPKINTNTNRNSNATITPTTNTAQRVTPTSPLVPPTAAASSSAAAVRRISSPSPAADRRSYNSIISYGGGTGDTTGSSYIVSPVTPPNGAAETNTSAGEPTSASGRGLQPAFSFEFDEEDENVAGPPWSGTLNGPWGGSGSRYA